MTMCIPRCGSMRQADERRWLSVRKIYAEHGIKVKKSIHQV